MDWIMCNPEYCGIALSGYVHLASKEEAGEEWNEHLLVDGENFIYIKNHPELDPILELASLPMQVDKDTSWLPRNIQIHIAREIMSARKGWK